MKKFHSTKAQCIQRGEADEMVTQTLTLGQAIIDCIEDTCRARHADGKATDMRCLIGALVSVLAHHVAGVPGLEEREKHCQRIGEELADAIETNVAMGTHAMVYGDEGTMQ